MQSEFTKEQQDTIHEIERTYRLPPGVDRSEFECDLNSSVWLALPSYDPARGSFRNFVYGIARIVRLEKQKEACRWYSWHVSFEHDKLDLFVDNRRLPESADYRALADELMRELMPDFDAIDREIIIRMAALNERPRDIAQEYGWKVNRIHQRLSRMRASISS